MIDWPSTLIRDIARKRAVLFLGAGVSRNSVGEIRGKRPPSWIEFLNSALKQCPGSKSHIEKLIREKNLLVACEIIKNKLGRNDWNEILRDEFVRPKYKPSNLHEYIFKLDLRLVLTQNFDKIYDTYAQSKSGGTVQIKHYYDDDVSRVLREDGLAVVKVHGTIDKPAEMIFTRKEYSQARYKYASFYSILDALTLTHTFLFLGCGLADPDIQLFLERYSSTYKSDSPHYIVLPKNETIHKDYIDAIETDLNLKLLTFDPRNNHKELIKSIQKLVELVDAKKQELAESQNW